MNLGDEVEERRWWCDGSVLYAVEGSESVCFVPFFRLPTMCEARFELETVRGRRENEDVSRWNEGQKTDHRENKLSKRVYLHSVGFLPCGGGGGGMLRPEVLR